MKNFKKIKFIVFLVIGYQLIDSKKEITASDSDASTRQESLFYINELYEYDEIGDDIDALDDYGETRLHQAAKNNREKDILKLAQDCADLNKLDLHNGFTPLHNAAYHNSHKAFQLLFILGADMRLTDNQGLTPFGCAARFNADKIISLLLATGIDINKNEFKELNGLTLLHLAAQSNADKVVRLLLHAGASINVQDDQGYTPLHWAARTNATQSILLLLSAKADITIMNKKGQKAAELTCMNILGQHNLIDQDVKKSSACIVS